MKAKLKIEIPQSIIDACVSNGVPKEQIRKTIENVLWLNAVERFFPEEEEEIIQEIIGVHKEETSGE
jgi:uncharacterized coiled-coil DUF342 family protein